jgi:hypothetical protein
MRLVKKITLWKIKKTSTLSTEVRKLNPDRLLNPRLMQDSLELKGSKGSLGNQKESKRSMNPLLTSTEYLKPTSHLLKLLPPPNQTKQPRPARPGFREVLRKKRAREVNPLE